MGIENNGRTNKNQTSVRPAVKTNNNTASGSSSDSNPTQSYEMVNHPQHYNNYSMEVIDMMEKIWGCEYTALWCEMTAFKYRMRMGTKPGDNSIQQDLKKEEWYLNKAKELRN